MALARSTTHEHLVARPVRRRPRPRTRCLVVSGDGPLRRQVEGSAAARGWECAAPLDAASLAVAGFEFGVVFIDLVRPPLGVGGTARGLVGEYAADPDTRVVVCGAADRPEEELWARRQGVAVYLPGVMLGPGFSALVRSLCR